MDKLKFVKLELPDGSYSESIPLSAEAEFIDINGETLTDNLNKKPYYYNNVASMKNDIRLKAGDMVITLGYYTVNDGGGADYLIRTKTQNDVEDKGSIHFISNNLVAELIVRDNTVSVKQFGAKGDGINDDTEMLKKIFKFKENNYIKIIFNANSTYLAKGYIDIYSNTDIIMKDATIKDIDEGDYSGHHAGLTFRSAVLNANTTGYGATKNINIDSGTLDGNVNGIMFALLHVENINFKNIHFLNCFVGRHIMDLCGCRNITIQNCNFDGCSFVDTSVTYREMIQPDYAREEGGAYWGTITGYDNLPTENLTITKCIFKKGTGNYHPNAIGSHSRGTLAHKNININNCEFYDCTYSCIRLPLAEQVLIDNNTFYDLSSTRENLNTFAINMQYIYSDTETNSSKDIIISNNKFLFENDLKGNLSPIRIVAHSKDDLIKNIRIINNYSTSNYISTTSVSGGDFLHVSYCDNIIIQNNICYKNKYFVYKNISGSSINSIIIDNNKLSYLKEYLASSNTYSDEAICNIEENNNIWTDDRGTINLNNFKFVLSLGSDIQPGDSNQKINIVYTSPSSFITILADGTIRIPNIIRNIKVSAYIGVTSTLETSNSEEELRIINRAPDVQEYAYSFATLSTEKIINYPILFLSAKSDKIVSNGFSIQHIKWLPTNEVIKASTDSRINTKLVIESY